MDDSNKGIALGMIAVIGFGLTLPVTRLLVLHVDPFFAGFGRIALAGGVAVLILIFTKSAWPRKRDFPLLALVAIGVIFGFPLLTSFSMVELKASNAGVIASFVPLITSLIAAFLFGERPSPFFWIYSAVGVLVIILFSLTKSGEIQSLSVADATFIVAVALGGIGYAAGGGLARFMKGWEVICWALALSFPISAPMAWFSLPVSLGDIPWEGYGALFYVALVSQLSGFFVWYHGMSLAGIARVSQTQFLQPFVTFGASVLILDEQVSGLAIFFCSVTLLIIALSKREPILQAQGTGR